MAREMARQPKMADENERRISPRELNFRSRASRVVGEEEGFAAVIRPVDQRIPVVPQVEFRAALRLVVVCARLTASAGAIFGAEKRGLFVVFRRGRYARPLRAAPSRESETPGRTTRQQGATVLSPPFSSALRAGWRRTVAGVALVDGDELAVARVGGEVRARDARALEDHVVPPGLLHEVCQAAKSPFSVFGRTTRGLEGAYSRAGCRRGPRR